MNLHDDKERREMVARFMQAETTAEEERLLADYYRNHSDKLSPEEEDLRMLLLLSATHKEPTEFAPSEEKEEEFDRMMAARNRRQPTRKAFSPTLYIYGIAAVLAGLLLIPFGRQKQEAPAPQISQTAAPKPLPATEGTKEAGVTTTDSLPHKNAEQPIRKAAKTARPAKTDIRDTYQIARSLFPDYEKLEITSLENSQIVAVTRTDGHIQHYILIDDADKRNCLQFVAIDLTPDSYI